MNKQKHLPSTSYSIWSWRKGKRISWMKKWISKNTYFQLHILYEVEGKVKEIAEWKNE